MSEVLGWLMVGRTGHRLVFDASQVSPNIGARYTGLGWTVTPLIAAPLENAVANVQAMLDRFRELAAFGDLRGDAESDEMDAIEAQLVATLSAAPPEDGRPPQADVSEAFALLRMALDGNQWNEWHRRARALLSRIPKEEP